MKKTYAPGFEKKSFNIKTITKEGQYALVCLKATSHDRPFTMYIAVTHEQLNEIQSAQKNGASLDFSKLSDNIVMQLDGHNITKNEHQHALEYFAKHFSGDDTQKYTIPS